MIYIFDFDGTVADTFNISYEIGRRVFKEYTGMDITPKELNRFKSMDLEQLKEFLRENNIGIFKLYLMVRKSKREMYKRARDIRIFKGMKELIDDLRKTGRVYIFSSNSKKLIKRVLENNGVIVDKIITTRNVFNKYKKLSRIAKKNKEIVYIGDDERDYKAAVQAGIKFIAVSWGFQDMEKFKDVTIARNIGELRKLLQNI